MKTFTIVQGLSLIMSLLLFTSFTSISESEPLAKGSIKGRLIDQETNEPVSYASVAILDADKKSVTGALSDGNGEFTLTKVPLGKYNLVVQFIGYQNYIEEIELTAKKSKLDIGDIILVTSVEQLDEVEVTGQKTFIENRIDKKIINVSEAMIADGNSTSEILNTLPEVNVGADGSISLRGDNNVRVLLDGKPSQMDINQVLQSLPADAVDKIEVITNPSSKYDPDGLSGIINVITKKDALKGFNGNLSLNAGSNNKYSGFLGLNYRVKRLNFFAQSYWSSNEWDNTRDMYRTYSDVDVDDLDQKEKIQDNNGYRNIKVGMDYFWDSTNTSTVFYERWRWESDAQSTYTNNYKDGDVITGTEYQLGKNYNLAQGNNINFNHRKEFSKGQLEIDLFANLGEADITPQNAQKVGNGSWQELNKNENQANWSYVQAQVDYDQSINEKSSFEVGYKGQITDAKMNVSNINFVNVDTMAYTYPYNESVHAVYGSYSLRLGNTSIKAGLRAEAAKMEGQITNSSQNDTSYVIDYQSLFPSVHIKQKLGEKNTVGISYSRRINRPDVMQLLPIEMSSNPKNVMVGNPTLQPSFTNSMELSHGFMADVISFNTSLYMRHSTDIIREVVNYDAVRDITVMTFKNLGSSMTGGMSLSSNYNMLKWWEWNGSVDVYYLDIEDENEEYTIPTDGTPINWSAKLSTRVTPIKTLTFQLMGRYTAKRYDAQRITEPTYSMDLAIKKAILNNKGSVNFKINNLLYSGEQRNSYGNGFVEAIDFRQESPVYRLSFSYAFGGQFQGRQKRKIQSSGGGL
ncbi:outer membrane beta-barrel protein [Flammeovirga kamogawensis]|uniref:TonB-dependent receptor n=1 Tax=Flammeovirga kamogawensis TaxID=373891 RepID=A0ABX8GXY6_9BACT|nr:outer membrane beta-barrel protein [Flammeovirga kamogawensis]MBB6461229.1 outer membrane receptor protein involved in Fe transport [Flammeovirga kamogawensis]QWG07790.1 TonB-dependent receptor [Flammeovirga kamogawensis]TRX69596.1 TonB-dependent receptor [Flammeovirga kamogawensis]